LLLLSQLAGAIKLVPPPTKADLAGVWVGPDESGSVLRLELDKTGTGLLFIGDHDEPGAFYKVTITTISGNKLSFSLQPKASTGPPFTLSGDAPNRRIIRLVRHFSGGGQGWGIGALLLPEDDFQAGVQRVNNSSARLHSGAKR
jgi:hypothetical protein